MKKGFSILTMVLLFISCGNRPRGTEPVLCDDQPIVELAVSDTVVTSTQEETKKTVDVSSSSSSSRSQTHSSSSKSSSYDNMRGFDPASEDDMEDNGMSRYMENNDEEGWD